MQTITGLSLRRRSSFLTALCLGLVMLADYLFYRQPIGWTVALFALAVFAAVSLRGTAYLRNWPGRLLAAAIAGLLLALLIEPGPLVIVMTLLALVSLAVIDRGGWTSSAAGWLWKWGGFLLRTPAQPLLDARAGHRWARSRGERWPWVRMMGGWLLPVLLSMVFVGLFIAANPIIERWFEGAPAFFAPLRLMLWAVVGFVVWSLLRTRVGPLTARVPRAGGGSLQVSQSLTGAGLVTRCLILFNAVFAVQTAMDIGYLWSGAALPEGFTYAQYAHRGAYPLLATALLAGLFVLATFRPGHHGRDWKWPRRLVVLWIAQNVFLMMSAVLRLSMYVDVYSLTRLRVAAAIWMMLVALGMVFLVLRIVANFDNRWLMQACSLAAVAVLYVCCFINFDGFIADYNVRHCREIRGGQRAPLDVAYLEYLGPESLPALRWARSQPAITGQSQQEATIAQHRLESQLHAQLLDWRGWTYQRMRLAQASPHPMWKSRAERAPGHH